MRARPVLQPLPWDSDWLGLAVARFVAGPDETGAAVAAAIARGRATGVRLLYLVLAPGNAAQAAAAQAAGAALADVQLTYELELDAVAPSGSPSAGVELARAETFTPALRELAWQSGEYSRFRRDARIGARAFQELYDQWLRQALAQGTVWAARAGAETVGLLALGTRGGHASIELLAVAPAARGRRVGHCLVQAARQTVRQGGATTLRVVTQGDNHPARHFYERCGFGLLRTAHLYHLWL